MSFKSGRKPRKAKTGLLSNLTNLLTELELSTRETDEVSTLLSTITKLARYMRWFERDEPLLNWRRLLEKTELTFLSRLKPQAPGIFEFKESLDTEIGSDEMERILSTEPKELERLWDKRCRFFIDEVDNVEDLRSQITNRDQHKCVYCGAEEPEDSKHHLHHVVTKEKYGGGNSRSNLVIACSNCNHWISVEIDVPKKWEEWKLEGE